MSRRRRGGGKNPYKKADRFTIAAKEQGYAARSVFKLTEVQKRFPILARGQRVVDLGCYPGSWVRYVQQVVGPSGRVVGVDFKAPEDVPGPVYLERSAMEVTPEELLETLGGPADVLLSDMAPKTVGEAHSDHVRQMVLVRRALDLADAVVKPGGAFLVKVFDGEEVPDFQRDVKQIFGKTRRIRPEAVRRNSREFFLLAWERKERVTEE